MGNPDNSISEVTNPTGSRQACRGRDGASEQKNRRGVNGL